MNRSPASAPAIGLLLVLLAGPLAAAVLPGTGPQDVRYVLPGGIDTSDGYQEVLCTNLSSLDATGSVHASAGGECVLDIPLASDGSPVKRVILRVDDDAFGSIAFHFRMRGLYYQPCGLSLTGASGEIEIEVPEGCLSVQVHPDAPATTGFIRIRAA